MTETKAPEKTKVHTIYKLEDGTRVPSVTTILGILNKPALLDWAWKCGRDGLDYKAVRDNAADIGTLAHQLIMCHLIGQTPDMSEYSPADVDRAENCVLSFYSWLERNPIEPVLVEVPLVSERHRYGGTCDCYGKLNGELVLLDFKTSKAIYPEMFYQVAAYRQVLAEHGHAVDRTYILRVNKEENDDFEVRELAEAGLYWEVFEHCLALYRLQGEAKRKT